MAGTPRTNPRMCDLREIAARLLTEMGVESKATEGNTALAERIRTVRRDLMGLKNRRAIEAFIGDVPVPPRPPRQPFFYQARQNTPFYQSAEWFDLRYRVLRRYGATCMCCGATRKGGATIQVDHIKPRSLFPELALDFDNQQVLCKACNRGKSNTDQTDWRPKKIA